MKSNEFITEDTNELAQSLRQMLGDSTASQIVKTVEQIKIHCKPFLNEIEDPFSLLRGLGPTQHWATPEPKKVRLDDRRPMSTPQWLHNELNAEFKTRFGAEFRNAMFCTGDRSQASIYGMVFAIFPIQDYKYLWSPEYRDLFHKFEDYKYGNRGNNERNFVNKINFNSYRTNGLNEAVNVKRGTEIMIRTYSYFGLNMNNILNDRNSGPIQNAIQDYLIQ